MAKHIVQFDKTYLDGTLADILIPGQCVSFPNYGTAQKFAALYQRVERDSDFIRSVNGVRFPVSNIQLFQA